MAVPGRPPGSDGRGPGAHRPSGPRPPLPGRAGPRSGGGRVPRPGRPPGTADRGPAGPPGCHRRRALLRPRPTKRRLSLSGRSPGRGSSCSSALETPTMGAAYAGQSYYWSHCKAFSRSANTSTTAPWPTMCSDLAGAVATAVPPSMCRAVVSQPHPDVRPASVRPPAWGRRGSPAGLASDRRSSRSWRRPGLQPLRPRELSPLPVRVVLRESHWYRGYGDAGGRSPGGRASAQVLSDTYLELKIGRRCRLRFAQIPLAERHCGHQSSSALSQSDECPGHGRGAPGPRVAGQAYGPAMFALEVAADSVLLPLEAPSARSVAGGWRRRGRSDPPWAHRPGRLTLRPEGCSSSTTRAAGPAPRGKIGTARRPCNCLCTCGSRQGAP